ncbi:hypothetical protein DFJ74DRAFT_653297 [Hyaloraphidium curvatum]|nr:hypothetical protein DFJ74DRAFT_653297 [Hyaloraphidium curvatum]
MAAPASLFPAHEIYAVRYAFVDRPRIANFLQRPDDHDGPGPLDFFVWVIKGGDGPPIVVDTGFSAATGKKRGRDVLRTVPEALKLVGVDAADVQDVIVTHMHYGGPARCRDGPPG